MIVDKAAPAGAYIVFGLALYVWHVAASLLGVVIADRMGISDSSPDLRSDLKKMAACSLAALSLFLALFYFARHPAVVIIYLLVLVFSLKVAYLGTGHGFLLVILGSDLAALIAFVPVAARLKLPGVFALYLAGGIAWLVWRNKKRRRAAELRETEMTLERRIRDRARTDPEFTTFCYQCLYHVPGISRCQLRLDGREVREIKIGQRIFCTRFRLDASLPPGGRETGE